MTHKELLAEINRLDLVLEDSYGMSALRAVIELHKPEGIDKYPDLKSCCVHCEDYREIWPCPTIQVILKELI